MKFKSKFIIGCISIALFPFASLYANPLGHTVTNGSATFSQQGSSLNITNSPGTIINWQDFSIQQDETTRFIQQSVDSVVLNRVVGQDPSQILGKLQSNGRVFIINPNGISFGANSIVDVGGLVASTLNISNEDFISQQLNFSGNGTNGSVNNQGEITTPDGGFVYLIAPNVENHGVITSPKGEVILAAGHSVQLVSSENPDVRVSITAPEGEALNVGDIITRGGKTSIYAGLINQRGTVNADSVVVGENGKIFFKASTKTTLSSSSITTANGVNGGSVTIETTQGLTEVSGKVSAVGENGDGGEVLILGEHVGILDNAIVDASGITGGGTILIGGDNKGENTDVKNAKALYVGVNTQIHADAVNEGNGGKVILWSDDATRAYGTITAKGGNAFGNGGFIETSGGYLDVAGLNIDVTANNGDSGTWLLDPYNITITGTTTINVTGSPNYTPTATGSNILNTDINAQLEAGTSVIVDTTNGGGGEVGNITVDAAITKTTGPLATLTLKAHNNIVTNAAITSTGGSMHVVLTADQDSNGTGAVTLNNNITTLGGNVTITSAGDITLNSGTNSIIAANATVSLTSTNGSIIGDPAGAPKDIVAGLGTINLTANNGIYANGGSASLYVDAANINFTNNTTGLVRIYNNHIGNETVSGSHNGTGNIILESFETANTFSVSNVTANNGYISFRTGNINITGPINAGANVVYMMPYTAAAVSIDGSQTFDVQSSELANITAGNIYVGKDTFANEATTASIATANTTNLAGKNVWLVADNGVTVGNFGVTNTGGQFYIDNVTSGNIQTGTGTITSDYIRFRSIGNVNIGTGGINSTAAGNVYLFGADVNIAGAVNAGTNSVYLSPYLPSTPISIGGSQTFDITQADINNITTSTLYIGTPDGSTAYASTVDVTSISAIDVGTKILNVYSTGNTTIGANNLSATGGSLQFYGPGVGVLTFGAGQTTSSTLFTTGFNAIITGTGNINSNTFTLNAGDAITIGSGGITAGAGGANLSATNWILQNGDISVSSTGTINLSSSAGYINMASTAISSTSGGNITYNANGNVALGRLYTGVTSGDVFVTSTTGSISDVGTVNPDNIFASTATLSAATGIGATGFNVYFNNLGTTNLIASTSSGGIDINSKSAMNIGSITTGSGDFLLTSTGPGSYITTTSNISGANGSIDSSDNLTIGAGGITAAGNLSLNAVGTLSQSGNITTTAGGSILLKANSAFLNNIASAGNIGIETDQISIANPIDLGGNNIYIMPLNNNPISIDGSEVFDLTQGELTNIMNFNNISIGSDGTTTRATTASISSLASTTVGGGTAFGVIRALNDITFGANNFSAVGADMSFISDTGNVTTGAGLLTADILDLFAAGTVTVGTGGVTTTTDIAIFANGVALNGLVSTPILYLEPYTASAAISVGGAQAFDINQTDINNIAATTTYIGNNSFVQNANNANLATAMAIDFGARNIIIDANNGIQTGGFTLAATGGDLTLISRNAGFDITTNAGNIAANNLSMTSARDIIIGAGGLSIANSVTATAANSINQNGNITSGGPGNVTFNASTQNITMAAGTITNSGSGNINYTAGGNITLALLDSNGSNTTVNASGAVLDANGNGVNNINANNLTVSSGGNSSLDYQVTGTLASAGVVGTADLRIYPATATPTPASSTNEPITTTIDTISDTTNSLSTDTSLTSTTTTTSTAPLADTTTESSLDSASAETSVTSTENTTTSTSTEESTDTTTSSTTEEAKEEESKEETQTASTEENKKQSKQVTSKKLPICK